MTFYEVVRQVLEFLRSQRRVSYRALKREFDIDDGYIEDLKEELLYAHDLVVEADDRGFQWIGETDGFPVMAITSDPPESQPVVAQVQPTRDEPPLAAPHTSDTAERRQLTVMFVDLVDSTRLSSQLDPEDLRDIVREYQRSCTEVVATYDGHVAQLLGDGLLIYFSGRNL